VNCNTPPLKPPRAPRLGSHAHRALAELTARGDRGLTSPAFQKSCGGSWRLASAVHELRRMGWAISDSWVRTARRSFKRYYLLPGEQSWK